ncbi:MAG: hypothetical protein J6B48_07455 [Clostridia bacterium]|nr:hypothetical protein [Clostridia bacterium]
MKTVFLAFVYALIGFVFGIWALGILLLGFDALQAVSLSLTLFAVLLVVFVIAALIVGAIAIVRFLNRGNMLIPILIVMSLWILFIIVGFISAALGGGSLFDVPGFFSSLFLI